MSVIGNSKKNNCLYCNSVFVTAKWSKQKFCNRSCSAKYNNKIRGSRSQETKDKISKTLRSEIKWSPKPCTACGELFVSRNRKTCSDKCFLDRCKETGKRGGIASSQSPNTKRGRSRSEIYFAQLIQEEFDNVLTNKRMFNGWDADIVLPDLKIAIHWNGPHHYLPVFGAGRLVNIQRRDKLRYAAIKEHGYVNYIIDDHNNKGFTKRKVLDEFNKFREKYA